MRSQVEVYVQNLRVDDWRAWDSLLSAEEKAQRDKYYSVGDRQAFTVCRGTLRQRLAAALGRSPQHLRFRKGAYGKPHLNDDGLSFNVSHSEDLALIAITPLSCVGVDIEFQRPLQEIFELAQRYFSVCEQKALRQLPVSLQREGFFHCWSRKEAFIKAIGMGLSFPLHRFDVSLDPRAPAEILALRDPHYGEQQWTLHTLCVAPSYSAALVTSEPTAVRIHPLL